MRKKIALEFEMSAHEAWSLSNVLKRVGYSEIETLAVDVNETEGASSGLSILCRALAEAGYDPR